MKKISVYYLTFFLIILIALPAFSEEEENVYVIQNKIFHAFHELGINVSYTPSDDFFDVFPAGIGYTYNFNEHFSWEVVRVQYAFSKEKSIKKDLQDNFGIAVSEFTEPKYFFHSNFIFRPLYGKSVFLNRSVINREGYISLGGGMVQYERHFTQGGVSTENVPSFKVAVGTKYFINEKFAVNIEIGDMVNLKSDKTENYLFFGIGLVYRFNMSPRKSRKDSTIERVDKYLRP